MIPGIVPIPYSISQIRFYNKMINSLNFRNYVDCEARQMELRKHLRELKDIKHFITSYRRKYFKNNKKTKYGEQIVFTMSNIKKFSDILVPIILVDNNNVHGNFSYKMKG